MKKHFNELTSAEVHELTDRCVQSAIEYADEINVDDLSELGVYASIEDAIFKQYAIATGEESF